LVSSRFANYNSNELKRLPNGWIIEHLFLDLFPETSSSYKAHISVPSTLGWYLN